jgi:hypothetical protein
LAITQGNSTYFPKAEFIKTLKNFEPQRRRRKENKALFHASFVRLRTCSTEGSLWLAFLENFCEFKEILTIKKQVLSPWQLQHLPWRSFARDRYNSWRAGILPWRRRS